MKYFSFFLLIVFSFISCTDHDFSVSESKKESFEKKVAWIDEEEISISSPSFTSAITNPSEVSTPKSYISNRKLIKSGSIDIRPKSIDDSQKEIFDLVNRYGGYVSNQVQKQRDSYNSVHLEVKIPTLQFDDFYADILTIDGEINNQNIKVNDVTEEFVDVQSRIKTKKDVELRYRELLKKAKNIEDVLKVEAELETLRTEIESYEGRLKFLKDKTNFSTLSIALNEKAPIIVDKSGFGTKLVQAFSNGWQIVLGITLGLINIWPILFLMPFLYLIIRRFRLLKRTNIE